MFLLERFLLSKGNLYRGIRLHIPLGYKTCIVIGMNGMIMVGYLGWLSSL